MEGSVSANASNNEKSALIVSRVDYTLILPYGDEHICVPPHGKAYIKNIDKLKKLTDNFVVFLL